MTDTTVKSVRSCYATYVDGAFSTDYSACAYEIIGKDSESLSVELNPDVEQKKNILDENMVVHSGYEPSVAVDDFYHRAKEALSAKIAEIAAARQTGEACKTSIVEVLYEMADDGKAAPTVIWAYREDIYCIPTSYGGGTSGFETPFQVYFSGNRTKGSFDRETKVFTETSTASL